MTKKTKLKVALVQFEATNDEAKNLATVLPLIARAKSQKAEFVLLPENASFMAANMKELKTYAKPEQNHTALKAYKEAAKKHKIWLLVGSLCIQEKPKGKCYNRSFLIDPAGKVTARYDKIHLFDATLPDGMRYGESANYESGASAVLANTPWGRLGMSICYDVRFPQLFRGLAKAGAVMLAVPAAFTQVTGAAHWHTLLRARAIENGCFVLAPGMVGSHPGGRNTFGHSLIISPWGKILADGKRKKGLVTAVIDLEEVERVRTLLPSLKHDRAFKKP